MYENNTKALMDMDWNYPEGFFEQFGQLETEEERIRLLYGRYKVNRGRFQGITLWDEGIPNQLENPGYQEEPGLYFYPCPMVEMNRGFTILPADEELLDHYQVTAVELGFSVQHIRIAGLYQKDNENPALKRILAQEI